MDGCTETDVTQVRIDAEKYDDRIPNPSNLLSVENRPWLWQRAYTTIEVQLLEATPKNELRCVDAVTSTGKIFFVFTCATMQVSLIAGCPTPCASLPCHVLRFGHITWLLLVGFLLKQGFGAYALKFAREGVEQPRYLGMDDGGALILVGPPRQSADDSHAESKLENDAK